MAYWEKRMKASNCLIIAALVLLWLVPACAWADDQPEAGFIDLEAVEYHFQTGSFFNRIALRSAPARIWTVFRPADADPDAGPLFVFFNGGPCHATCEGLMSANTAPRAVAVDERTGQGVVVDNPSSWTRIGNLLYIDSRTAGFSYSLMENPEDPQRRRHEFEAQNYNSFFDGADFVRVILRFLAAHPRLQRNRVVIVGESYGGIRATVMLNLLFYYKSYADGRASFQDAKLVEEIQSHYDAVFPQYRGQTVPPAVIAGQFSHQVLIQPGISNPNQKQVMARMLEAPGSIICRLAAETGIPYIPWKDQPGSSGTPTTNQILNNIYAYLEQINRDLYMCAKPAGFTLGTFAAAADLLCQYEPLCQLIGVDVAAISEMYAHARLNAYKIIGDGHSAVLPSATDETEQRLLREQYIASKQRLPTQEDLSSIFGVLQPWDRFYLDLNDEANLSFIYNRLTFSGFYDDLYWGRSQLYGQMFLENTAWVDTFITNAAYDLVVFAPAIPEALALHTTVVSAVRYDPATPSHSQRPGQILLTYHPGSVPGSEVHQRSIRFPSYCLSGHAVTITEPAEILADVTEWLRASEGMTAANQGE
jgi:hypothetical protein